MYTVQTNNIVASGCAAGTFPTEIYIKCSCARSLVCFFITHSSEYRWPDEAIYRGEFAGGHREGEGTYTFADGSTYTGEWSKGRYHGVGQCVWKVRRDCIIDSRACERQQN